MFNVVPINVLMWGIWQCNSVTVLVSGEDYCSHCPRPLTGGQMAVIIARHSAPNLIVMIIVNTDHSLNIIYFPNITKSNLTSLKYFSLSSLLYPRLSFISALLCLVYWLYLQELGPYIMCRTVEALTTVYCF